MTAVGLRSSVYVLATQHNTIGRGFSLESEVRNETFSTLYHFLALCHYKSPGFEKEFKKIVNQLIRIPITYHSNI